MVGLFGEVLTTVFTVHAFLPPLDVIKPLAGLVVIQRREDHVFEIREGAPLLCGYGAGV